MRAGTRLSRAAAILTAILLVGGAASLFLFGQHSLVPRATAGDITRTIEVPSGSATLVCPPAPKLPDNAVMYDAAFNPKPVRASTAFVAASMPRDGAVGQMQYGTATAPSLPVAPTGPNNAVVKLGALEPGVGLVTLEPPTRAGTPHPPLGAGAGAWRVDGGEYRGLVSPVCVRATSESWIVAGSSVVGDSAALSLTNPGSTPITVSVQGWGPLGPLDLPLLKAIVIAPRATERVLIEASAAGLERLALRVVSKGGKVAASLLDHKVAGVTPRGISVAASTSAPSRHLVMPGVRLATTKDSSSPAAAATTVRVVNPGSEPATASIRLLGSGGETEVPGASGITIDPGAVFDIPLTGVAPGDYAVEITSSHPLTAATQVAREASGGAMDRMWAVATDSAPRAQLALPGLGSLAGFGTLQLTNKGSSDLTVTVRPFAPDGAARPPFEVKVPARTSQTVPYAKLGGAASLDLEGTHSFNAAAVLVGQVPDGSLITGIPALPDFAAADSVRLIIPTY